MSTTPNIPVGANIYSSVGNTPSSSLVNAIRATRGPTIYDIRGPQGNFTIGQRWVDTLGLATYTLGNLTASAGAILATWITDGGGSSALATLSGDTGTAVPSSGNIQIAGTANEITTAAAGSVVTLSLPTTLIAPGTFTSTGVLAADNGIACTGNISFQTAGSGLQTVNKATTTAAGANVFGSVTLVSGTATVATTSVATGSLIVLWRQSIGSTGANPIGELTVGTIVGGTSFVINSANQSSASSLITTDVSVVGWMIIA